ncbi:hypothetical protein F5X99DRAFT_423370 [Biscogniauxia marginata]|nr:hypothetical protein F5X99DRAFT_423370 [Biscogniauxia marginata]
MQWMIMNDAYSAAYVAMSPLGRRPGNNMPTKSTSAGVVTFLGPEVFVGWYLEQKRRNTGFSEQQNMLRHAHKHQVEKAKAAGDVVDEDPVEDSDDSSEDSNDDDNDPGFDPPSRAPRGPKKDDGSGPPPPGAVPQQILRLVTCEVTSFDHRSRPFEGKEIGTGFRVMRRQGDSHAGEFQHQGYVETLSFAEIGLPRTIDGVQVARCPPLTLCLGKNFLPAAASTLYVGRPRKSRLSRPCCRSSMPPAQEQILTQQLSSLSIGTGLIARSQTALPLKFNPSTAFILLLIIALVTVKASIAPQEPGLRCELTAISTPIWPTTNVRQRFSPIPSLQFLSVTLLGFLLLLLEDALPGLSGASLARLNLTKLPLDEARQKLRELEEAPTPLAIQGLLVPLVKYNVETDDKVKKKCIRERYKDAAIKCRSRV